MAGNRFWQCSGPPLEHHSFPTHVTVPPGSFPYGLSLNPQWERPGPEGWLACATPARAAQSSSGQTAARAVLPAVIWE
jgi:hypothetical protein